MLSLLKKKSEAAAAPTAPAWHPNFRNYEKLPDIKVVRTAFFVNGGAVLVALAALLYLGRNEWQLYVLRGQIAEAERQIDRDRAASGQAVALFKKFQAEEAKILEVDTFVKSKPVLSDLILHLGATLPNNIAIDSLDIRDSALLIRMTVRGTPEAASRYATAYLEQLRADPKLASFEEFRFTAPPTRNPSTGRMVVEFLLRMKGVRK